jgi:peptide/nickel transport system substrate-binding protein
VIDQLKVEKEAGLGPEGQRAWLKNNQATSAKYYIDKHVPLSYIILKRNPKYWGKEKAAHPSIEIRMVTEASQQVNALKKGDTDVIFDAQLQEIQNLRKSGKKVIGGFDSQTYYLGLNMKEAPFNNADVREAVRYAIDYDGITKGLLANSAVKAGGILGRGFMGYDQSLDTKYKLDIQKAKSLLTKAGFPNGFETTIHLNTGPTKNLGVQNEVVMTKIQADLAKVGIKVQLIVQDVATLFPIYRSCQDGPCPIRGIYWSFGSVVPDVDPLASAHGDWNVLGTRRLWDKQNDFATSALGRARFTTNVNERNELYKSVGRAVSGKAGPYVFLFRPKGLAITGANVKTVRWVPFWVFEAD